MVITKKILVLLSSFFLMLLLVSVNAISALAQEPSQSDYTSLQNDATIIKKETIGNGVSYEINSNGVMRIYGNGTLPTYSTQRISPLSKYITKDVKHVSVEKGIKAPINSSYLFSGLSCVSLDLSALDTSNVTDMGYMFSECLSLTSINLSNFDTSNVTNMRHMFSICRLASLDLSAFDTSNVTDMSYMFFGLSGMRSLDLSALDTSMVINMNKMFSACRRLASLDLSAFDTSNVTDMSYMFESCRSLVSLDLSQLNTSKVTNMTGMFSWCDNLIALNFGEIDTSKVISMNNMFEYCESLTFLDLSALDTSNVTYMNYMFENCVSLSSLNLSAFDTSNVQNMKNMFYNCASLSHLDLNGFITSKVINMSYMFSGCSGLSSLNLSRFDTSKVTDMSYMFSGCSGLASLDLSAFDTSNVTDIRNMFENCTSLSSLDLSGFDTVKTRENCCVFDNCNSLCKIVLGAKTWFSPKCMSSPSYFPNFGGNDIWTSQDAQSNDSYTFYDLIQAHAGTWIRSVSQRIDSSVIDCANEVYSGSFVTPKVIVKLNDTLLREGIDYAVAYSDNVNTGTGKVVISGIGDYAGTKSATFQIVPADISSASITGLSPIKYTGLAITPVPIVKLGTQTLSVNSDYDVRYSKNVNVGIAILTVNGKGNYTGSVSATFPITKAIQPMRASVEKKTVTSKSRILKKKAIMLKGVLKVKGAQGRVTYSNVSKTKMRKLVEVDSKTGRVTVKKGTKKGTYTIKVKVSAMGNASYNPGSNTLSFKVKVI